MSFYLYIRYGGSLKRKALPQNTPSRIDLLRITALCSAQMMLLGQQINDMTICPPKLCDCVIVIIINY